MGFLDKAKGALGKAETFAGEHTTQMKAGLDKAEGLANKATKGKFKGAINSAGDKAEGFVDGLNKDEGKAPEAAAAAADETPPAAG